MKITEMFQGIQTHDSERSIIVFENGLEEKEKIEYHLFEEWVRGYLMLVW